MIATDLPNMPEKRKPFKSPPKRFQPRGLPVLYEDHDILVVDKASGVLTVATDRNKDNTAYSLLTNYVRKGDPKSKKRIFIVHRLDRDTSGVIVFAKTEGAKRYLQDEWPQFKKKYFAVVHGTLPEKEEVITSYLAENRAYNMYSVEDPSKGKLSKTGYRVLKESKNYSLLEIELLTGRKNQIRVHFSERSNPLVGDKLYGIKEQGAKRLTLHAGSLTIVHPHTKEKMSFETKMPAYFRSFFQRPKEHGSVA